MKAQTSVSGKARALRLLAGVGLVIVVLGLGFAWMSAMIETWGSTPAELALALPGDELLDKPVLRWTHAITINAPVEQVWPWIIQMGDTRAGFYSYMFVERAVGGDYNLYVNADRVHPEWQSPPAGQGIIAEIMQVREYEPGRYLLAVGDEAALGGLGWTWLWYLEPLEGGRTRLLVHMHIQTPPSMPDSPILRHAMNVGTFLMELDMLQGIKLRAEGGHEPAWVENAELALWLAALAMGLAAAVLFVARPAWQRPLLAGLVAVAVMFVMVYLQPELWAWAAMDAGLLGLLWWSAERRAIQE